MIAAGIAVAAYLIFKNMGGGLTPDQIATAAANQNASLLSQLQGSPGDSSGQLLPPVFRVPDLGTGVPVPPIVRSTSGRPTLAG